MKYKHKYVSIEQKREAMRLVFLENMSARMAGRLAGMSHNTVRKDFTSLVEANKTYDDIEAMSDYELESLLKEKKGRMVSMVMPDWSAVHKAMQEKHMTLQLLWEEYAIENPGHYYSYSQFTHYYRQHVKKLDVTMRQTHFAGECVFVDFAGTTVPYKDAKTGETHYAQIFIGVLGCSNYTFAYAVRSQRVPDWLDAHNKMYQFYGGAPQMVVPDNLKAAVIQAGRDSILNPSYLELSKHYQVVVVPARPIQPQDKSKGELGVKYFSRWGITKLLRRQFFSIAEINEAIAELLIVINKRPFKNLPGCRRSRFEELDKPLLRPLPATPYEYAEFISPRKIGPDYHLKVDDHYYSVPHELVGQKVKTRYTKHIVEFIYGGKRIANHIRSYVEGGTTTIATHQPKAHRAYADLTPEKLISWAKTIGPASVTAVQYQFDSRPHKSLGLKACSTLKKLAKDYGHDRFEAACRRAELIGSLTVKSIRSILQRRLSELPENELPIQMNLPLHDNVRGASYYQHGGH
jgi:transposase